MKKHSYAIPLVIVLIVMAGAISLGSCLGDRHDAKMAASADSLYCRLDADSVPFMADVSRDARFMIRTTDSTTYFCDIIYPATSAHLYCTFRLTDTTQIGRLHYEAQRIVSFHSRVASSIEAIPVRNRFGVEGTLYELRGDVATPYQLALSDEATFFFNASLYFDDGSHADAVPGLVGAMKHDIDRLVYSFTPRR